MVDVFLATAFRNQFLAELSMKKMCFPSQKKRKNQRTFPICRLSAYLPSPLSPSFPSHCSLRPLTSSNFHKILPSVTHSLARFTSFRARLSSHFSFIVAFSFFRHWLVSGFHSFWFLSRVVPPRSLASSSALLPPRLASSRVISFYRYPVLTPAVSSVFSFIVSDPSHLVQLIALSRAPASVRPLPSASDPPPARPLGFPFPRIYQLPVKRSFRRLR